MSGCSPDCAPFYGCCFDDATKGVACVPVDDNLHCGSCSPCQPPAICCDDVNPMGRTFSCVDVKANDNNNCGACGLKCSENTQGRNDCCKGRCVDFKTDEKNCGSCGTECVSGRECCGGGCVDLTNDVNNCGGCGNACAPGDMCILGVCTPPCTPCVGYDGVEDCCPPDMACHTEPIKGGPCLPY
jgi:hypothetical protein